MKRKQNEVEKANKNLYKLYLVQCEDLLCLAEMEWNGMCFDSKGARNKAKQLQEDVNSISDTFKNLCCCIAANISSGSHLSAILYGGSFKEECRIPVGVYKTEIAKQALGFRGEAAAETAYQKALDLSGALSSGSGFIIEKNGKKGLHQETYISR